LSHLNCGNSRGSRAPNTLGEWNQPSSVTVAKQVSPSLVTRQPDASAATAPGLDRFRSERFEALQLDVQRTALVVQRHGGHKRHFVPGAAPGLVARVLATEVGVVKLHLTRQRVDDLSRGDGVVDLVVQRLSGGVCSFNIDRSPWVVNG
jgi:hypothetical protein